MKKTAIKQFSNLAIKNQFNPWLENKIERARSFSKHYASRAPRFGAPAGVALLLLIVLYSLFQPKDRFQLAKEKVLRSPMDYEAHLILAEEFLKNNQLKEAEKELLTAQKIQSSSHLVLQSSKVLGLSTRLEELWSRWREENPQEIRKMIADWEKFVAENPTYRDGYLKLALYYFKLGETVKAQENLQKALELDPNYDVAKEIQKAIE